MTTRQAIGSFPRSENTPAHRKTALPEDAPFLRPGMFLSHEACPLVGQRAGPEGEFHVEHWKAGQGARTQLPTPVPWDRPLPHVLSRVGLSFLAPQGRAPQQRDDWHSHSRAICEVETGKQEGRVLLPGPVSAPRQWRVAGLPPAGTKRHRPTRGHRRGLHPVRTLLAPWSHLPLTL